MRLIGRIEYLDKLALLYEYQQADAKLEAYEKKLKNTATRKQLIKLQNYLKKQQAVITSYSIHYTKLYEVILNTTSKACAW